MVLYNVSNLEASTSFYEAATQLNILSGGLFAGFFLATLSIFFLILFSNNPNFKKIMLANSFITALLAIMLWAIGWLDINIILFPIIYVSISIIINVWGE